MGNRQLRHRQQLPARKPSGACRAEVVLSTAPTNFKNAPHTSYQVACASFAADDAAHQPVKRSPHEPLELQPRPEVREQAHHPRPQGPRLPFAYCHVPRMGRTEKHVPLAHAPGHRHRRCTYGGPHRPTRRLPFPLPQRRPSRRLRRPAPLFLLPAHHVTGGKRSGAARIVSCHQLHHPPPRTQQPFRKGTRMNTLAATRTPQTQPAEANNDFQQFLSAYGIELSPQQQRAAATVYGPTLLTAVPGSGKTTTLTARLGYMIRRCGINPSGYAP